jgi:undecaprenyl phosphate N,N'-diacetylbacillosamine 1-phosphate transferase
MSEHRFYRDVGKRSFDLATSLFLIAVVSPLLLAAAAAVRATSGRPVLFRQVRLGRSSTTFTILKLRTMSPSLGEREQAKEIALCHREVTPIGRLLRRFKIDELPQLLNVARGEMSLVGPRPALPDQIDQYDETSIQRLRVRPGLTGLAQVSGNISLRWEDRWKLDVEYVRRLSFALDLEILVRTVGVVVMGENRQAPTAVDA